jgi:hypothetical protein
VALEIRPQSTPSTIRYKSARGPVVWAVGQLSRDSRTTTKWERRDSRRLFAVCNEERDLRHHYRKNGTAGGIPCGPTLADWVASVNQNRLMSCGHHLLGQPLSSRFDRVQTAASTGTDRSSRPANAFVSTRAP